MKYTQKIVNSWLIIALAIAGHNVLEISEALFFMPLPEKPAGESIPTVVHIINLTALVLPIILGYLSLFFAQKGFKMFSFIYAVLLGLLNVVHLGETMMLSITNYTQIIILLFVVIVNIVLIVLLNKWRKQLV